MPEEIAMHEKENPPAKKTVGIVTLSHNNDNYGGLFQAVALQAAIDSLGYASFLMNTAHVGKKECNYLRKYWLTKPLHPLKRFQQYRKNCSFIPCWDRRFHYDPQGARSFSEFVAHPTRCDAYVCGSDQVWAALDATDEARKAFYFLSFAPAGIPRIAYAASFGNVNPENPQIPELLSDFHAIGIREKSAVESVARQLRRKDVTWVCDPTLLQPMDFWNAIADQAERRMSSRPTLWNAAYRWKTTTRTAVVREYIAQRKGLQILAPYADDFHHSCSPTPEEWLNEVRSASFVLTNSFHCAVFSILFHRPFLVQLLDTKYAAMNERIVSLLSRLGLESRILRSEEPGVLDAQMDAAIDWGSVDRALMAWSKDSWTFLTEALA